MIDRQHCAIKQNEIPPVSLYEGQVKDLVE